MGIIITKEKINTGRQKELDIAKGLAVIFMVLVHVYEVYGGDVENTGFSKVVEFLGSPPAAPIFMFLLGAGVVYSKKSEPRILFIRGIKIFILSYVLNFVRDFIPYMIIGKTENDMSSINEAWNSLFGIDILAFAALAIMFFALIKKLKLQDSILIVLWCVFSTLGLILKQVSFDSQVLNSICGLVWGTGDFSWFPFLNWIFYPIFGYLFAKVLIRCSDKDKFYKNIFIITAPLSAALWVCTYVNKIDFGVFDLYQTQYYHHDIIGNIIIGVFVLLWISIIYLCTKSIPDAVYRGFARWSRNCSKVYCIHWIILGYSMLLLEETYNAWILCVLAFVIFILSDVISELISKVKIRR